MENIINVTSIRELYLPQTGLYTKEADCLGKFLSKNSYLQVLDISNNSIGDRGLEVLTKGLINQNKYGPGLSVLVIFNNQITERSGSTISKVIVSDKKKDREIFWTVTICFSKSICFLFALSR